jgi:hypothetical protein
MTQRQSALNIIIDAALERASTLEWDAKNPFVKLSAQTSGTAASAWAARQQAAADSIRAAVAEVQTPTPAEKPWQGDPSINPAWGKS